MSKIVLHLHPKLITPLGLVCLQKLRNRQGFGFNELLAAALEGEMNWYWVIGGEGNHGVVALRQDAIVAWRFRHGRFIERA